MSRSYSSGSCSLIFFMLTSSPVIGQDGTIYVVIGEDMLFAVSPAGSMRWVFAFDNEWEMSFTSPAIDQNGVIYLATEGKPSGADYSIVYAVNPNGSLRWKYHRSPQNSSSTPPR